MFKRLYEEYTDSSAFEHINPDLVFRVYIDVETPEGEPIVTIIPILGDPIEVPYKDYKEAHRFIKRLGGVA